MPFRITEATVAAMSMRRADEPRRPNWLRIYHRARRAYPSVPECWVRVRLIDHDGMWVDTDSPDQVPLLIPFSVIADVRDTDPPADQVFTWADDGVGSWDDVDQDGSDEIG